MQVNNYDKNQYHTNFKSKILPNNILKETLQYYIKNDGVSETMFCGELNSTRGKLLANLKTLIQDGRDEVVNLRVNHSVRRGNGRYCYQSYAALNDSKKNCSTYRSDMQTSVIEHSSPDSPRRSYDIYDTGMNSMPYLYKTICSVFNKYVSSDKELSKARDQIVKNEELHNLNFSKDKKLKISRQLENVYNKIFGNESMDKDYTKSQMDIFYVP